MNKTALTFLLCIGHIAAAFGQEVLVSQPLSVKAIGYTKSHTMFGYSHLNSNEVKIVRVDSSGNINLGSSNGGVKCFAFNAAETRVATGSYSGTLELWDLGSGTLLWSVEAHEGQINDVKFSDGNDFLITCGVDGKVRISWLADGGFVKEYNVSSPVNAIEFHPVKKNIFVTGAHDGNITFWKLNMKEPLRVIKAHDSYVLDLEFTGKGDRLLSSSHDQTIKTWNFSSGKLVQTSRGHTRAVYSIAISPDERTFASGAFDKEVKVWRLQDGKNIKNLKGHSDYINVVRYTPEGDILSGSRDGTLRLWKNVTQ